MRWGKGWIADRYSRELRSRIRYCGTCREWHPIGEFPKYQTRSGEWRRRRQCREACNISANAHQRASRQRAKEGRAS